MIWSSKFQKIWRGAHRASSLDPPLLFLGLRPRFGLCSQISGASRPRFRALPDSDPNFWSVFVLLLYISFHAKEFNKFSGEFCNPSCYIARYVEFYWIILCKIKCHITQWNAVPPLLNLVCCVPIQLESRLTFFSNVAFHHLNSSLKLKYLT